MTNMPACDNPVVVTNCNNWMNYIDLDQFSSIKQLKLSWLMSSFFLEEVSFYIVITIFNRDSYKLQSFDGLCGTLWMAIYQLLTYHTALINRK